MIRSYRHSAPRRTYSKKSSSQDYSTTVREFWMCLTSPSAAKSDAEHVAPEEVMAELRTDNLDLTQTLRSTHAL
jgi:hypothetical protein